MTLLAVACEKKAGNGPRVALIRKLFAKERPASLKGWPAILQLAVSENNASGAGIISQEDRAIICNIQREIRQHPSNVSRQRTQEETSSSDYDADALPPVRCNLDHEDDDFPCDEFSESD